MKLLENDKLLGSKKELAREAAAMAEIFPRMGKDFAAIAEVREMYRRCEIDSAQTKRKYGALGRRVAILPPPLFIWLSHRFPEVLTNKNHLRSFLRANPHLLVVDKL
jgi:hypothetical protein